MKLGGALLPVAALGIAVALPCAEPALGLDLFASLEWLHAANAADAKKPAASSSVRGRPALDDRCNTLGSVGYFAGLGTISPRTPRSLAVERAAR